MKNTMRRLAALLLCLTVWLVSGCGEGLGTSRPPASETTTTVGDATTTTQNAIQTTTSTTVKTEADSKLPAGVPAFSGSPYAIVNGNQPQFDQITATAFERYASLDALGRCGVALACCGTEIMPAPGEERGSISSVYPSGWKQATYDFVSGRYLYNRCHLIGWQLSAENANRGNLITGTKYININGMLPFENMVADYIKDTGNHVMYRITPYFYKNELVARGVQMEAYSVEDEGDGICFNVFCYNVQPGVVIDYASGASYAEGGGSTAVTTTAGGGVSGQYILNTSSRKIHLPHCGHAAKIADKNRQNYTGNIDALLAQGYTGCGTCKP